MRPLFLPGLAAVVPVCFQAVAQRAVFSVRGRGLVHDHDIKPFEFGLMLSERLPNNPLEPIPLACLLTLLLRNREPEAGDLAFVLAAKYGKPFVAAACGFFEHTAERCSIQQPAVFRKPVPGAAFQFGCFLSRLAGCKRGYRGLIAD